MLIRFTKTTSEKLRRGLFLPSLSIKIREQVLPNSLGLPCHTSASWILLSLSAEEEQCSIAISCTAASEASLVAKRETAKVSPQRSENMSEEQALWK